MYGAKARVQSKQVVERLKGLTAERVRWLFFRLRSCHMVFLSQRVGPGRTEARFTRGLARRV